MTWSGVCLRAIVSVIPPVSIVGHEYSHSHWTTFRGPNQPNAQRLEAINVHIKNGDPSQSPTMAPTTPSTRASSSCPIRKASTDSVLAFFHNCGLELVALFFRLAIHAMAMMAAPARASTGDPKSAKLSKAVFSPLPPASSRWISAELRTAVLYQVNRETPMIKSKEPIIRPHTFR